MSRTPGSHRIIGMEEEEKYPDLGRTNFLNCGDESSGLGVIEDGFKDAKKKNCFLTFPQADLFLVELPMD